MGLGHLQQRNAAARRAGHVGTGEVGDGLTLALRLTQHQVDQLVAFAELTHGGATEQHPGRLGDGLAGHTQSTGFVLVHFQAQHFH